NLTGRHQSNWLRWLEAAQKRPHLGAVLLFLDGDARAIEGGPFCARQVACRLAQRARRVGAGTTFSVAVVFACREYESWFIACVEHLAGKPLPPDDRPGIRDGTPAFPSDPEVNPRDAKGWLGQRMHAGYKETRDQEPLTRLLTDQLPHLRGRPVRSFRRLENALLQLIGAIRSGTPVATPEEAVSA